MCGKYRPSNLSSQYKVSRPGWANNLKQLFFELAR